MMAEKYLLAKRNEMTWHYNYMVNKYGFGPAQVRTAGAVMLRIGALTWIIVYLKTLP